MIPIEAVHPNVAHQHSLVFPSLPLEADIHRPAHETVSAVCADQVLAAHPFLYIALERGRHPVVVLIQSDQLRSEFHPLA